MRFNSFIVEGNTVRMVNSAVYAMQMLQSEMKGEAERAGLTSDEDIMSLVKELRNEDQRLRLLVLDGHWHHGSVFRKHLHPAEWGPIPA